MVSLERELLREYLGKNSFMNDSILTKSALSRSNEKSINISSFGSVTKRYRQYN